MKEKNYEQYKRIFRFAEALLLITIVGAGFAFCWYEYFNPMMNEWGNAFNNTGNFLIIIVYIVISWVFLKVFGGFEVGFYKKINNILSQLLAMFCANVVACVQVTLMVGLIDLINSIMAVFGILTIVEVVCMTLVTFLFDYFYTHLFPAWKMLLIYETDSYKEFLSKIATRRDKYEIKQTISISEGVDKIEQLITDFDAILIYDVNSAERNDIVKFCYGEGVRVYQTPKISDILIRSAGDHHLFDTPLLMSKNIGLTYEQKLLKRLIDILFSAVLLLVTSPVMLITAICIKLYDHGPVFFVQKRVTMNEKEFRIYKFRSMIVEAEADGKARPATSDDDRITPIGRLIRKTRIDELPQFINVLKGDMSIVGPRPERVEHVKMYTEEIPEFKFRTKVKGGITGYAQVYGKYNTTAYDKLKLDLMYIENYSIILDLKLMLMTIKTIFVKTSTEGFSTAQEEKMLENQASKEPEKLKESGNE